MRIALFGGTFDPPHNGHLQIAQHVLKTIQPDEIWFVPNAQNPLKANPPVNTVAERIIRLKLLTAGFEKLRIVQEPAELTSPVTVWKLLQTYQKQFPENQWLLVIGADQAAAYDKWSCPTQISRIAEVIVCQRPQISSSKLAANAQKYGFKILNNPLLSESSTYLRSHLEWVITQEHRVSTADFKYFKMKQELSKKRREHCFRTAEFGLEVAHKHRLGVLETNQIGVACYLHDIAKEWSRPTMEEYLKKHEPAVLKRHFNLWHGFAGAYYIADKYHINVPVVQQALKNHTQPCLGMSLVEKVVYIADKLERGRSYPGIDDTRKLVFGNINEGFKKVVQLTWHFLQQKKISLPPQEAAILQKLMVSND